MTRKYIYIDLSWNKYRILEPTISELYEIDNLTKDTENIQENYKRIFDILGISEEYMDISHVIIQQVIEWFREKKEKSWWNNYFLWVLWMLAYHNYMDIRSFMEKYCFSDISELMNIREYYYNILNDKASDNVKFYDKTPQSKERDEYMEYLSSKI